MIDDIADSAVRQEFLRAAPEYLVSDDLSWLDDIVFRMHGEEIDSKAQLAERLRTRYRALRAYHGTAANSLDSFYNHGLRPLVIAEFHDRAREIFLGGQFPELSEANLLAAIEEVGTETREGHVFFEANEELLVEMCGHYLLYGSEYLVALAAHLGEAQDYRRALKRRSTPTLFICDVPIALVCDCTLREFAGTALKSVFQGLLDGVGYAPCRLAGVGFSIRTSLDAASIVGHCHPTIRRDPIAR